MDESKESISLTSSKNIEKNDKEEPFIVNNFLKVFRTSSFFKCFVCLKELDNTNYVKKVMTWNSFNKKRPPRSDPIQAIVCKSCAKLTTDIKSVDSIDNLYDLIDELEQILKIDNIDQILKEEIKTEK